MCWGPSENRQEGWGWIKYRQDGADDVDGNWTLLSGVIATDSTIVFNNRLDNINLQKLILRNIRSSIFFVSSLALNQISKVSYSIFECKELQCQIEVRTDEMEKRFALLPLQTHLTPGRWPSDTQFWSDLVTFGAIIWIYDTCLYFYQTLKGYSVFKQ